MNIWTESSYSVNFLLTKDSKPFVFVWFFGLVRFDRSFVVVVLEFLIVSFVRHFILLFLVLCNNFYKIP